MRIRPWYLWLASTPLILISTVAPVARGGWLDGSFGVPGIVAAFWTVLYSVVSVHSLVKYPYWGNFIDKLPWFGWLVVLVGILVTPLLVFAPRISGWGILHAAPITFFGLILALVPAWSLWQQLQSEAGTQWGFYVLVAALFLHAAALLAKLLEIITPCERALP